MKRIVILGLIGIIIAFLLPTKTAPMQETVIIEETPPVAQIEAPQAPIEPISVPEPQPEPTPVVAPINTDCVAEIYKYDWRHDVAIAVMMAESGGNNYALNNNPATGDYSIGCFQINLYGGNARTRPSEAELYDASVNVAFAYRLYSGNGNSFLGQWGVCRKIACY